MAIVAQFEVLFHQVLDPSGETQVDLPAFASDPSRLVDLYRAMLLTREFDNRAVTLQRTGQLGTFPSSLGQEAVSVGLAAAMTEEDILVPSFREQGAQLWRGVSLLELLLYWGGDERGSAYSGPVEDFPVCVPVGSQTSHAVGLALALKLRGEARAVVCVIGDGATSKGDFYEAMNFAGAWQLPLLFIVNNNEWAISVPRSEQTASQTLAQKAIAAGFQGEQVDGNDVIAMCDRTGQALEHCRNGEGPHLIEALSYRLADHTTADDATRYRDDAELSERWQAEPMARLHNYMVAHTDWSRDQEEALIANCREQVEAAVTAYLDTPPQPASSVFDYLYDTLPEPLRDQRDALVASEEVSDG